jgi:hypothetical protein
VAKAGMVGASSARAKDPRHKDAAAAAAMQRRLDMTFSFAGLLNDLSAMTAQKHQPQSCQR